ncbi:transposase [Rhodococcus sp. IEGM 248]|uniref:IS701 family transposase n=1 Tax=Rhodococcus opacus TaxID=37919 RepID=UPI0013C25ABE|nr:transposase [Rhodococcus opacus]MDV7085634.1 transposase [Rhodococcus opacus]NDV06050.1 transposase [Rhodococcus sp. IEGM 248]
MRKTLSRRACGLIAPDAWVIDDTGFTKDGDSSPGVARQYSGTLGKVGNCQIAVSVHAATDAASAPLDWRLFLPESWDDRSAADPDAIAAITARRRRSAIPFRRASPPQMGDGDRDDRRADRVGPDPAVVVADAGYGDTTAFRLALTERGIDYVVAVKGATSAHPGDAVPETAAYSRRGRPSTPRTRPARTSSSLPDASPCAP